MTKIHHLKLSGKDPHGWGLQQGETFRNEIREINEIRQELLRGFLKGWSHDAILELCRDHATSLQKHHPDFYAEVLGISEATSISIENLMALNAYTDLRDFSAGDNARSEDGCSILAAKSASVNFSAQTWDMHGSATPFMLLLEVPAPIPMHVLTITGCLGLAGVNSKGVSVMINNMHCRETHRHGAVWPALVRRMLEAPDTTTAAKTLAHNIPSSGHNYLIFDRHQAMNIETSGQRFELTAQIRDDDKGYLIHTNHYLGSLRETEIIERQSPTTHRRFEALTQLAAQHPVETVSTQELIEGLFVQGPACDAINIPFSAQTPHAGATCGGLGVDHHSNRAFAFRGLYAEGHRIEWPLT
jgi:isopenicillin-N N-acyltransferase like protein